MKKQILYVLLCAMNGTMFGASGSQDDVSTFKLSCSSTQPDAVLKAKRIDMLFVYTNRSFGFYFREAYFRTRQVSACKLENNPAQACPEDWTKRGYDGYMKTGFPSLVMAIKNNGSLLFKFFVLSNPTDAHRPDLDSAHIHTVYDPDTEVMRAEIVWKDATKQQLKVTDF